MESFETIVNNFQALTIAETLSILHVCGSTNYASDSII